MKKHTKEPNTPGSQERKPCAEMCGACKQCVDYAFGEWGELFDFDPLEWLRSVEGIGE